MPGRALRNRHPLLKCRVVDAEAEVGGPHRSATGRLHHEVSACLRPVRLRWTASSSSTDHRVPSASHRLVPGPATSATPKDVRRRRQFTVIEYVCVTAFLCFFALSVIFTLKVDVPAFLGVPEIRPLWLSLRPLGNLPIFTNR